MGADARSAFEILYELDSKSREKRLRVEETSQHTVRSQYIKFRVADASVMVPLTNVSEITTLPEISTIPFVKPWIAGVANVRGDAVPVTDFSYFLFNRAHRSSKKNKLLVFRSGDNFLALLVDEVLGMTEVGQGEVTDEVTGVAPELEMRIRGSYESDGTTYVILDVDSLMADAEFMRAAI